jgi:hypothetical protein
MTQRVRTLPLFTLCISGNEHEIVYYVMRNKVLCAEAGSLTNQPKHIIVICITRPETARLRA